MSLSRLPGGSIQQEYYDGVVDKRLNYEIQVKVKPDNRQTVVSEMTKLTDSLIALQDLASTDGSFLFNYIQVGSELYVAEATDGFIYFRLDFQPLLTIQKGE